MNYLTLTIDELMMLGPHAHRLAVELFEKEIAMLRQLAQLDAPGSPDAAANGDKLAQLISLRNVHQGRLEEYEADYAAAETDGSTVAIAA
jgi:hypothetical protein